MANRVLIDAAERQVCRGEVFPIFGRGSRPPGSSCLLAAALQIVFWDFMTKIIE